MSAEIYVLKDDKLSNFPPKKGNIDKRHIYGLKGERVKIICDDGDVLIVEGKKERFSVRKEDLIKY